MLKKLKKPYRDYADDRQMTTREVADYLECTPTSVNSYAEDHGLAFVWFGNQRQFLWGDVKDFIRPKTGRPPSTRFPPRYPKKKS